MSGKLYGQARCKELQKVVPTLAELEELDQEAQELPGVVLDLENLSRCAAHSCWRQLRVALYTVLPSLPALLCYCLLAQ